MGRDIKKFSIKDRISSFKYALEGLKALLQEEQSMRVHLSVAFFVIVMGVVFNISFSEWLIILVLMALVFSLEIINSCLERLCDIISPEWNIAIKRIKDMGAAAVLVSAVIAIICGGIIFLPKLCDFLK